MQISKISDIEVNSQTSMIYGVPGAGKTTVIGELPGKTLILDLDKGTSVLAGSDKDISVVRFNNVQEIFDAVSKLEKDCPFDFIALDSVSELQKIMLTELGREGRNSGVPEMRHYQQVDFKITDLCRRIRNLGKNFVMTAWELQEEITDESGVKYTRAKPMLSGKTISETVCGLCEMVGRIVTYEDKESGDHKRVIAFDARQSMYAKDRINKRKSCNFSELYV